MEDEKKAITVDYLPTTKEMIAEGLTIFERVVRNVSPELQYTLLRFSYWKVFVGVEAERGSVVGGMKDRDINEIEAVLKNTIGFIDFIRLPRSGGSGHTSMVNIPAAHRVLQRHPDYFEVTGSKEETFRWLKRNTRLWGESRLNKGVFDDKVGVRTGLLSGYPEEASVRFYTFKEAMRKVADKIDLFNDSEKRMFGRVSSGSLERSEENITRLKQMIERDGLDLSGEEKQALLNVRLIENFSCNFFGFSEDDQEYADQINQLVEDSGIEDLILRLRREIKMYRVLELKYALLRKVKRLFGKNI